MPRDDLSIDFVKRMPPGEVLDPSMVLDDWINRAQNLPEEIRFIQDEIADKDRQYNDMVKIIEDRDMRIQKFIKAHGSHEPNPREEPMRSTIRENFAKADKLAAEKIALMEKMKVIMDKHLRQLDIQIKMLYDRNEPGFSDPDELPSLLRPIATQTAQSSSTSASRQPLTVNTSIAAPLSQLHTSAVPMTVRVASSTIRSAQAPHTSSSAPATPAASMILGRQREGSAGPSGIPKRGPRINSGLGTLPGTSSGLARHSSLGPGTPKGHQTATGAQRAGSAGPRASTKGATTGGPGRKASTPSSTAGRKKSAPAGATSGIHKSGLSRVKRAAKASPSSTADSELSEASSASGDEGNSSRTGTPGVGRASSASQNNNGASSSSGGNGGGGVANGGAGGGNNAQEGSVTSAPVSQAGLKKERRDDDEEMADGEDDEAGDDRKYCICQAVSFGDMVACDNDDCPFEWFHWSCVGLKSEPNGTWYCPVCTENMKKSGLKGK